MWALEDRLNQTPLLVVPHQYCDLGQSLPTSELVPHLENGNNHNNNDVNTYFIELS